MARIAEHDSDTPNLDSYTRSIKAWPKLVGTLVPHTVLHMPLPSGHYRDKVLKDWEDVDMRVWLRGSWHNTTVWLCSYFTTWWPKILIENESIAAIAWISGQCQHPQFLDAKPLTADTFRLSRLGYFAQENLWWPSRHRQEREGIEPPRCSFMKSSTVILNHSPSHTKPPHNIEVMIPGNDR
jgi:hypothetical protein